MLLARKLISLYLQSESSRPLLEKSIFRFLDFVSLLPPKDEVTLSKSAIIKANYGDERGIILVGFEHELDNLLSCRCSDDVLSKYDILFMPTWQPFYSDSLLRALKKASDNLYILPSSENCYYKAFALPNTFKALPFHASSWVNPNLYYVAPVKDIDILMVANFSTYKRHYLLFEALRDLPSSLKVVLVGRPLAGRTAKDLIEEARAYGVDGRFELIESATNQEIVDFLARAKLVLGLSGREGSYVSLAEALFAGAAVGVYANAHIGTKSYINPRTGFLYQNDVPLYKQIQQSLDVIETLNPRGWAVENISAHINLQRLNDLMRFKKHKASIPWTVDCSPFYIQSFQVEPFGGGWSDGIIQEVNRYNKMGLRFRGQCLKSTA